MWKLSNDGLVATKTYGEKVKVRVIADNKGTRYHEYNDDFKLIGSGVVPSIKAGMEKFNGYP